MKIEIITTGDEVISGVIVDTNTAWIAERCAKLGHDVIRHSSVRDDLEEIRALLLEAHDRADAVIVTGGLGPTSDDLTIEAASKAFDSKLELSDRVLSEIKDRFKRMNRIYSSSNDKQAMVPAGARVLPNPVGTAPGIHMSVEKGDLFFLPGVPRELYRIFEDSVGPWLEARRSLFYCERVLNCFGLAEATLDERLRALDLADVRLSFRVRFPEVVLKVVARAELYDDAKKIADDAAVRIKRVLGDIAYGEGEESLASVVGAMLADRHLTISTAESCTGGLLADLLTDVPGSSRYFERGVVTYSNASKVELLSVPSSVIDGHGAVSKEVAIAMANGVRNLASSSIAVAITGVAGPDGGTDEKPVGTVHIALAYDGGHDSKAFRFERDRRSFKQLVAATALDLVRMHLKSVR